MIGYLGNCKRVEQKAECESVAGTEVEQSENAEPEEDLPVIPLGCTGKTSEQCCQRNWIPPISPAPSGN